MSNRRHLMFDVLSYSLGWILLLAAILKWFDYSSAHSSVLHNLATSSASLGEVVLACWLLSGIYAEFARKLAILTLGLFSLTSLYYFVTGHGSCGCFGQIRVHPIATFVGDAVAISLLWVARPRDESRAISQHKARFWVSAMMAISIISLLLSYSAFTDLYFL